MTTASQSPLLTDVSELPTHAFGLRAPVVWGALLLVAIESTMMGLLLVSDIYLRGNLGSWPSLRFPPSVVRLAVLEGVLLVVSAAPALLSQRAARREESVPARKWLAAATVLGVLVLVTRAFLVPRLPFRWDENAYTSVYWTVLVLHTTHLIASVAENVVLWAVLRAGPVEKKNFVDVDSSWILWAFTVLEWLPAAAILYHV